MIYDIHIILLGFNCLNKNIFYSNKDFIYLNEYFIFLLGMRNLPVTLKPFKHFDIFRPSIYRTVGAMHLVWVACYMQT